VCMSLHKIFSGRPDDASRLERWLAENCDDMRGAYISLVVEHAISREKLRNCLATAVGVAKTVFAEGEVYSI